MAEVSITAETQSAVEKIGLLPLNNILVNLPFDLKNPKDKPIACSSTVKAACLFKPEIRITPSSVGGLELPSYLDDQKDIEQLMQYWRNCYDEKDLVDHFHPDSIVEILKSTNGDIGLLLELRTGMKQLDLMIAMLDGGGKSDHILPEIEELDSQIKNIDDVINQINTVIKNEGKKEEFTVKPGTKLTVEAENQEILQAVHQVENENYTEVCKLFNRMYDIEEAK